MRIKFRHFQWGAVALSSALIMWPMVGQASGGIAPAPVASQFVRKTLLDIDKDSPEAGDTEARKDIENALRRIEVTNHLIKAQGGDLEAQAWLGAHYFSQTSFISQVEGFRWLMIAAQGGDITSQLWLAQVYDGGHGMSRNRELALQWYEKAAALGNAGALAELCLVYVVGEDRPRDIVKAKALCQKAGDGGNGRAYYALGLANEQGLVGYVDLTVARARYGMAVSRGNVDAMDRLGVLAASPDEARPLFRKAMAGGSRAAAEHLAQQYIKDGDQAGAVRLFRYAAMRGSVTANRWLADNPVPLRTLPLLLSLHSAGKTFAIVKIPAHDGLPMTEIDFWDYFSQASDYYPDRAASEEIEGESHILCHISPQRKITDCLPISETPEGYGFNDAIIHFLDRDIEVKDIPDDSGQPLVDRDFELTFKWQMD